MDKIKKKFQDMPLKKTLLVISIFCLGIVILFTVITIVTASHIRQKIWDSRPIMITDYKTKYNLKDSNEITVIPNEYVRGELSGENKINYVIATFFMIVVPIVYIVIGSVIVAKLYYRLKLQIPIKMLRNGMDHISKQDLDFQIQYVSNDELGILCDTFECMRKEVYQSNCKLWDMLQERKALTASISHDLRTPITVIKGYLDYLNKAIERDMLTNDILKETIQNMTGAARRLERYVDCVKDVQKIEEIEIEEQLLNIKDFIADIEKDFNVMAKQHNRNLEFHDFSYTAVMKTDRDLLLKVLENILDNAFRFSNDKIILTIRESKNYISFVIQDDGVGFSKKELNSATTFFYSSSIKDRNFGIGLSICNVLCKKLGGALYLENEQNYGAKVTAEIRK